MYITTSKLVIQNTFWNVTNPNPLHWGYIPFLHAAQGSSVCAILPILTLGAGMSLAHGTSIWPSWDVYPGGPMHFSMGTLGPSISGLRVGLSEGCTGGWARGFVRVLWVGGT